MDRKKLYDMGWFLTEKLYRWERKVFLMIESDRELQSAKEEYLAQQMTSEQVRQLSGKIERAKREKRKKRALVRIRSLSTMAAALVAALIILPNMTMGVANAMENIPFLGKLISVVTFRDYHYEDENNAINVGVPELVVEPYMLTASEEDAGMPEGAAGAVPAELTKNLKKTTDEINAEIQTITDQLIEEFEENMEQGHQDMMVKSQTLSTTEDYFALKLICFQAMGSGAEWDYFYTIDLSTGERLTLADLFPGNDDYI